MIGEVSFLDKFRSNLWWRHIVPPLVAAAYLGLRRSDLDFVAALSSLTLFLLSVILCASFGYFVNDWADIEVDQRACKKNSASNLPPFLRPFLALLLFITGVAPWYFLPSSPGTLGLLLALLFLCVLYSARPIRLKGRAFWGVTCDILYGHVLPTLVAVNLFWPRIGTGGVLLLIALLGLKGFRNILLHQLDDECSDRELGIATAAVRAGSGVIKKTLSFAIIPAELALLFVGCILVFSSDSVPFWVFLIFSLHCIILSIRSEALSFFEPLPFFGLRFTVNDYYEKWLPIGAVLCLGWSKPEFVPLIVLHIFLFPRSVADLLNSTKQFRIGELYHSLIGRMIRASRRKYAGN